MGKRGMTPQQAAGIWETVTKLQKIRVKNGLSQNDLSAISGLSKSTIQGYEVKARDIDGARLKVLCDLCLSLNCKLEDILEDEKLIKKLKMVK